MKIKIIGLSIVTATFLMFSLTATAKHHPIKKERYEKKVMSIADMTANLQFDLQKLPCGLLIINS